MRRIVLLMLLSFTLQTASASHYITGIVNDALDGEPANGKHAVLWNPAKSIDDNLTTNTIVREFNLDRRTNDNLNDVWNAIYWRIYVPMGTAGSRQGNIIFGALQAGQS